MAFSFDPGALLGASYPLHDGTRARLRLARCSDAAAIATLLGVDERDLAVKRLVQFDPRRRYVLCATTLTGEGERLIGVGAIAFEDAVEEPAPDVLVVHPGSAGLADLLSAALIGSAEVLTRARAA